MNMYSQSHDQILIAKRIHVALAQAVIRIAVGLV